MASIAVTVIVVLTVFGLGFAEAVAPTALIGTGVGIAFLASVEMKSRKTPAQLTADPRMTPLETAGSSSSVEWNE